MPGNTIVEKEYNRICQTMKRAHEKGVMIVTGSDSFNSDSTPFGVTLIGEVHALVDDCGFSEMEAILAATSNGAKALEAYFLTGSLQRGKCAELLVINGDPLKDIHDICMENITMSMDGADKTTGLIGFKRYNIYKFDMKEWDAIENFIKSRYDIYRKCFNESDLAQSILSDLLNEGLISEK